MVKFLITPAFWGAAIIWGRSLYLDFLLEKGVLPDNLTIAKVTSLFKAGDTADLSNYRPKSVLPCFSKMPEGVIYNHLYQRLLNQEIFHPKQFGF